ncbi:MAG: hypothetical protein QOF50_1058 [Gaiellaceae bacterium]|nr:hypothetical protein [Gaiellaceae bacterium]
MKLELVLDTDPVAQGEKVTGRVDVVEGGPSRSLTLTLSFHEQTQSYSAVRYSSGGEIHSGELVTGQPVDFDFTVPAEAPPSLKSAHAELYWQLAITSDEHGLDTHAQRRLEVIARRP